MIKKSLNIKSYLVNCFLIYISLLFSATVSFGQLTTNDTANVQFINSRKFYIYKVDKGETLYSISQKFKIPQEEILQFNSDVEKNGLKNKMKIWVPAYSWLKKDSINAASVDSNNVVNVNLNNNQPYKILIVSSLQLPKIFTGPDTSYINEPLNAEVRENLHFVEGVLSGTDVRKNKFKIHLFIIDSEGDSLKLLMKLRKHKDCNLIITNETGSLLKTLSSFSESYKLNLFSCGVNTFETIRKNENAFAFMPSASTQCEQSGVFAAKYFTQSNPMVLRTASWKENERSNLFSDGWRKVSIKQPRIYDYSKDGVLAIGDSLSINDLNIIFIPTSNEEIVSSVLIALKEKVAEYRLNVIGLPTWQYFETVDQSLFDFCNVHLFSSGLVDYNSDVVLNYRKYFRDKYYTEPNDISFQGYDAFTIADALLLQSGVELLPDESQILKGIYSDYRFVRADSSSGFENKIIHILQPSKEGNNDLARFVKFN